MEYRYSNYLVSILIVLLFIVISGCSDYSDNNENYNSGYYEIDEYEMLPFGFVEPIVLQGVEDHDYRKAIINEILFSIDMSEEEHINLGNYRIHRISDIEWFYYPTICFDGFILTDVLILSGAFIFRYTPLKYIDDTNAIHYASEEFIEISIRRQDWYVNQGVYDQFFCEVEQAHDEGWGFLSKDDLLYAQSHRNIVARLGTTTVRLDVPDDLNKYEILRDFIYNLIETIEKVDDFI